MWEARVWEADDQKMRAEMGEADLVVTYDRNPREADRCSLRETGSLTTQMYYSYSHVCSLGSRCYGVIATSAIHMNEDDEVVSS